MTFIEAVSTHLPPYRYKTSEIVSAASRWLNSSPDERALFERLSSATQIETRAFALPIEEILALGGQGSRATIFREIGPKLLKNVIEKALTASSHTPEEVEGLILTSCSVATIPAIDVPVIQSLGMSPTILRIPLFQHGCVGGAIGLGFANHVTRAEGITLLTSVELCSLVYQAADLSGGNIVGSAIFGDGAACVVLSQKEGPLRIVSTHTHLIPNSYGLMGYDILDDGMHLRLEKEVPQCLAMNVPDTMSSFLAKHKLAASDIAWWIFHPGGAKILNMLETSLGLSREQTHWGWDTLRDNGNMSSASVLFALSRFLEDRVYRSGDKLLMLGVGPGLTLHINLFECLT